MKTLGIIPRKRLKFLPEEKRVVHEYCFFLHDECVRLLKEYEEAEAHLVSIPFKNHEDNQKFEEIAQSTDPIEALSSLGYLEESKRVMINTITMAMVSDCLHHIYEALICFEKRKFIVGFNILRKPLLDSLIYLSWILCREEEFYSEFLKNEPDNLTQSKLGNHRLDIFEESINFLNLESVISANELNEILYSKSNEHGLYMLFQHAVHLVTVQNVKLRTAPQNFNFIFKSPISDDVYDALYHDLPYVFLYMSHVIHQLFNRMRTMDKGAKEAFITRSTVGYSIVSLGFNSDNFEELSKILSDASCNFCRTRIRLTDYNFGRIILTDSFRCGSCKKTNPFPFSWAF